MCYNFRYIIFTVVLVIFLFGCGEKPKSEYELAFEERRERIINYFVQEDLRWNYLGIAAKLLNDSDVEKSLASLDSLLSQPSGDMFWMYPSLSMYLFTKDRLPEDIRKKYRDTWRTYTPYRGDTENHWVMYYVSLYLAAEEWPNEPGEAWFNGKSSEENKAESKEWINHWIHTTTTIGQGEFDSPHYMTVFLAPMFMLYEFAKASDMRKRGEMMIEYLLADFAAEYLRGNYCGGHSREAPNSAIDPRRAAMNAFGYLFFGDTEYTARGEALHESLRSTVFTARGETLLAALTSYRMPEVLYHIATDRSERYVHTETKRVRNVIRYGDERNPPVYKYNYMTQDYCIGSLHGDILQPIQQHTWDVTFDSPLPNNTIFTLHPYYSSYELGMFFPEHQKLVMEAVVASKGTYNKPDKWTGSSPFEQTMQYKNAIIVLYDIEPGTNFEHIDGFFPKNLIELIHDESGWIFMHGGNTYIAYYPLQEYDWIEEDVNWRLRSHVLRNGLVMEVASVDDYESFDAFQEQIRSNTLQTDGFNENLTVEYVTSNGDELKFTYPDGRYINGDPVDFSEYRLFNSKFLQADIGSEKLTMTAGGITRELDFSNLSLRERRR
jgi:hypothetical protein